jgi:hypothetical protein
VRADEKLTAFMELELAVRCSALLGGLQESRRFVRIINANYGIAVIGCKTSRF